MTLITTWKSAARRILPAAWQVPFKYWYEWFRGFLEPEMALLPVLLRPQDCAFDVGANRGAYAYRLARLCAKVELFEPNPACAAVLEAWARHTGGRVNTNRVALSDSVGEAALHIPLDAAGVEHDASASLTPAHPDQNEVRNVTVPLVRLDDLELPPVDLIKIDVEGHELAVLRGSLSTIRKSQPALLVEIEARHLGLQPIAGVFEFIQAQGYQGYFFKSGQLRPVSEFDPSRDQPWPCPAGRRYYNNFLFLSEAKLREGRYAQLPWGGKS